MSLDEQISAHVSEMKADGSWAMMERYAALLARSGRVRMVQALGMEPDVDIFRDLAGWLTAHPMEIRRVAYHRASRVGVNAAHYVSSWGSWYPVRSPDELVPILDATGLGTSTSYSSSTPSGEGEDDD